MLIFSSVTANFFSQGILVLAATNRPHAIDAALIRPGRFDLVRFLNRNELLLCFYYPKGGKTCTFSEALYFALAVAYSLCCSLCLSLSFREE